MNHFTILLSLKVFSYFLLIGLGILIPQKWLLGIEKNYLKIFAARFVVFVFLIGFVYLMLLDTIPMLHSGKGLFLYALNGYALVVLPALLLNSMEEFPSRALYRSRLLLRYLLHHLLYRISHPALKRKPACLAVIPAKQAGFSYA